MNQEFVLPRRRRRVRPYLDLTAMIDTVFNLLIFFAVASTLVGARTGLPLKLPTAESAQPVPERVVLRLLPGQPVQVNGQAVATDQIGPALDQLTSSDTEAQVVVVADEKVPYAELVAALDQVRLADYHRIALAATRPPDESKPAGAARTPRP
jgi:biopolymer transport protein ExbD